MITLYNYSDITAIPNWGQGFVGSNLMSFQNGSYGVLLANSTVDPVTHDSIYHNIYLRPINGISGNEGKIFPLLLLGGSDSYEYTAAQLSNGNIVEIGGGYQDGEGYHEYMQLFGPDGTTKESLIDLGQFAAGGVEYPTLTVLSGGGFIVGWNEYDAGTPDNRWQAMAQVFSNSGAALTGPISAGGPGDQGPPSVAVLSDTTFVEAWVDRSSGWAIRAQVFNTNGEAMTDVLNIVSPINNYTQECSVAGLANGDFVVTWRLNDTDFDTGVMTNTLLAQVFHADGTAVDAPLTVDHTESPADLFIQVWGNRVISLPDGRFVVSWQGNDVLDTGEYRNYGLVQIFEPDGTPASSIYSLGENDGFVGGLTISSLPDGRIAATWVHSAADSTSPDLETQILDPRDHGIDLTGNALADQYAGSVYNDTIRGVDGNDTLYGNNGNDLMNGGAGDDQLLGGYGNDSLFGTFGNDFLSGFNGNDRLNGGKGADLVLGGRGHDVFVFAPGDGADRIKAFVDGQDRIDLTAYGFGHVPAALRHFADVANGVEFTMGTDSILILGMSLADLTGADLIIH